MHASVAGDNFMDINEAVDLIKAMATEMHLNLPPMDRIEMLVGLCDKTGDGVLQMEEFFSFFKAVLESAVRHIEAIDIQAHVRGMRTRRYIAKCKAEKELDNIASSVAAAVIGGAVADVAGIPATKPPPPSYSSANPHLKMFVGTPSSTNPHLKLRLPDQKDCWTSSATAKVVKTDNNPFGWFFNLFGMCGSPRKKPPPSP